MDENEMKAIALVVSKELANINKVVEEEKRLKEGGGGKEKQETFECPECGTKVNGGAKYCLNCGTELEWEE